MGDLLEVGLIERTHGLRGDVIVKFVSNVPERLAAGSKLYSKSSGAELKIRQARRHKKKFIVAFEGIDTPEAAETLRGEKLIAKALEKSEAGDLWLHELIGAEIVDQEGTSRGKVCGLEAAPAGDILVLSSGALVPARFIVSHREGILYVDVPDGLFAQEQEQGQGH